MSKPIKNRLYSSIYFRAKNELDTIFLASIPMSFFVSTTFFSFLLSVIAFNGLWLVLGQTKGLRYGDAWVGWGSVIVGIYCLIHVMAYATEHEGLSGLCIPFPALLMAIVPFAVGIVLIRNPLKAIIIGCRFAIALITVLSIYYVAISPDMRQGFGTNPVIAAYMILLFACISRFPIENNSPAWHGAFFFYLGFSGALSTGTRNLWLFFMIALALDLTRIIYNRFLKTKATLSLKLFFAASCTFVLACWLVIKWLPVDEFTAASFSRLTNDLSIQTRFHLWEFGWREFLANPIFGMGQCHISENVNQFLVQEMGLDAAYKHLHNLLIHELAVYGLVGFLLVVGFHILLYIRIYPIFISTEERWAFSLFYVGIFIYGLTGSYLSDERMVAITALMCGIFIAEGKRRQFKLKIKNALNPDQQSMAAQER